jgi:hypothetical protein
MCEKHGCELQPIDFSGFARICGWTGFTIESPAEYGGILSQALAAPGPAIIEAVVDPFESPMPSKVTLGQAIKFALSLAHGEPNGSESPSRYLRIKFMNSSGRLLTKSARSTLHATKTAR